MFHNYATTLVASLALAVATPMAANAAQIAFTNSPVAISACDSTTSFTPAVTYDPSRSVATDLHYRFVNNAGVAAQAVTLEVSADGQTNRIVDRGNFSPAVAIDRNDEDYTTTFAGNVTCRVTQVDFRDGSSWHAGAAAKLAASH